MNHLRTLNPPLRFFRKMEPLVFKRWTNQKWAILASFHKIILIGTLCFSYNILAQNPSGVSQDSTSVEMHLELDEVEAVAESPFDLESISLKSLTIVNSQEILSAPATTHEELLEYIPHVDIRNRGKYGTQADLNIQGGSFDQSMVLLNGINLTDPQTGHFHLNLPVDLSAIHQIEVVAGSAARRFGAFAFSGAVNFVTQPQDSTTLNAGLRFGQHNYYKAILKSNVSGKYVSTLTSISTSGSDGYKANTDFKTTNIFLHTSTRPGKLNADLMLGLNTRAFGANAFYSPRFLNQYEETTTSLSAVKIVLHKPRSRYTLNTYLRVNKDYFLLDRYDPSVYRNDHLTRVFGADLNGRYSSQAGVTNSGFLLRREAIFSTSLGEPLEPGDSKIRNDEIDFNHRHIRNQLNWNINHTIERERISLEGGILLHLNSDLGLNFYLLPGIDIRFLLPHKISLLASLNKSMRLPTFTDLYYQGPANVGNAELVPEKANTIELGISRKANRLQTTVNGFYRQGRNLIDWIWMEDEKWHTKNLTEVDAMGSELQLKYIPANTRIGLFSVTSLNLSYTFTYLTKVSEMVISRYLLDNLKHKVVLSTNVIFTKNLTLSGRFNFQDRNGTFLMYNVSSGESIDQPYEPFLLLDMKLTYSFRNLHLFLESTNLLDVSYHDIGNLIQPGRWSMIGIELR